MSIDHKYNIGNDGNSKLMLNISGLDSESKDISALKANVYAYCSKTGDSKFTCQLTIDDLKNLYQHLSSYSVIKDESAKSTGRFIELKDNSDEIMQILEYSDNSSIIIALQHVINNRLTNNDINIILGRKEALQEYEAMINNLDDYNEPEWQVFFERNEWIFGYGLRYKYLSILQREAHISNTDLNGTNGVITDFLMSDSRFTKIVELKTPKTSLFVNRKNRADSWCLSSDLTDAVSQILAQKANWEIDSQRINYTSSGDVVHEKTHDPECILVIGSLSSITGSEKEKAVKLKTIELYRRNLKNIEILFYDELLERARFIVTSAEEIEKIIDSSI